MGSCGVVEWPAGTSHDTHEGSWVVCSLVFALNINIHGAAHRRQRLTRGGEDRPGSVVRTSDEWLSSSRWMAAMRPVAGLPWFPPVLTQEPSLSPHHMP